MADFTAIDLFGEIYDADDANAVQQSQVVPTVDSDSDDDHVPTAKAVWDAIVSGQIPAFHYEEFELPANCTNLDMDIDWIDATDDQSEHYTIAPDSNYPLNAIRITGLNNVDVSFNWDGFPYDGKPSDWTDINDLMMVSTPTDCYIYVKVLIYASGGLSFSDYMRFRILDHSASASAMGADLPKYARVWDDLTMHPEVNASGNIDKIVLNGTERALEDPNAADQTLSNLTNASDARDNLGLGAAATKSVALGYAAASVADDLVDIGVLREANSYNTEKFVTTAANSVLNRALYQQTIVKDFTGNEIAPGSYGDIGNLNIGPESIVSMSALCYDTDLTLTAARCYATNGHIYVMSEGNGEDMVKAIVNIVYAK